MGRLLSPRVDLLHRGAGVSRLEQLRTELDRYEAAHGTDCRHPDGRLESRSLVALIGRAVLEIAESDAKPAVAQTPPSWKDEDGDVWVRGARPGIVVIAPHNTVLTPEYAGQDYYWREACAALWPDFPLPKLER